MRRAAIGLLLSGVLAVPVHADTAARAEATFELCRERVQAVRLVPTGDGVSVHARLTESSARELARQTQAGHPVDVRAGQERFARFVVREALRARPPRTIRSAPIPAQRARALGAGLQRPCASVESR